jgi:hypothetical protein
LCIATFELLNEESIIALMLKAVKIPCLMCNFPYCLRLRDRDSNTRMSLEFNRIINKRGDLIPGSFGFNLKED